MIMRNIFLISLLVLGFSLCKPKESQSVQLTGLAVFKSGSVKMGAKPIQLGDKILEGEALVVEPRSTLDLQVIVPKTELIIRLKEKTNLLFRRDTVGKPNLLVNLQEGEGLFNVNSPLEKDSIGFTTPTAVLGIRGTKFSLQVAEDGGTKVAVLSGKVAYKPAILALDSLPKSVREEKFKFLDDMSLDLESGNQITITPKDVQSILKNLELEEIVNEKDPKVLQQKLESWKVPDVKPETWANALPKPQPITEKDKQNWTEEFEDLSPLPVAELDKPNLVSETVVPRSEKLYQEKLLRLEKKLGKKSQTILLKDGRKFTGILNITEKGASVISPTGTIELTPAEAEEMEIE